MKKGHNRVGGIAGEELQSIVSRIERLEEEKAGIAGDIREVYAEAKGRGFDQKTIRQIVRLRKMGTQEREEYEALLDIYKAALGMLDGTPLGEAAIRRLTKGDEKQSESGDQGSADAERGEDAAKEPEQPAESGPTLDEARDMGRKAAENGEPVTSNPFPARDPRRAAWDEEWCRSAGSDGMDLPDAWRRAPKKKGDEDDNEGKAA